jgi:glutamine synthetase
LHQSLVDAGGHNALAGKEFLSSLGESWLAGLLEHAVAATVFATPTVNGYRRYRPNSLAPDRASWGFDHRGAMIRVLGGKEDPATRFENRLGEPAANPYLYIASQIVCGLDGVERKLAPRPRDDEPYSAERPLLPTSLGQALDALQASALFRRQFGEVFVDYYLKLMRSELGRYQQWVAEHRVPETEPTDWEQDEYFDFF